VFIVQHNLRAQNDLLLAVQWYELQQKGLGEKFLKEYENLEYYIGLNPKLFPEKYKTIRQASMNKFPYVVLFRIVGKSIRVISIFNCHQNPKKRI
jgi:hypothetical protein